MDAGLIIWGTFLILASIFVPGWAVTAAIIPRMEEIRWSERFGLALVFGITPFLLMHFLTKNISFPITTTTMPLMILAVTVAGLAVWKIRSDKMD
jgi:hypothetical protein